MTMYMINGQMDHPEEFEVEKFDKHYYWVDGKKMSRHMDCEDDPSIYFYVFETEEAAASYQLYALQKEVEAIHAQIRERKNRIDAITERMLKIKFNR